MEVRCSNNQQKIQRNQFLKKANTFLKSLFHQQIDDWLVETCDDEDVYDSIRPSTTGYILYKCTINSYSDIELELKVSRRLNHELLHWDEEQKFI